MISTSMLKMPLLGIVFFLTKAQTLVRFCFSQIVHVMCWICNCFYIFFSVVCLFVFLISFSLFVSLYMCFSHLISNCLCRCLSRCLSVCLVLSLNLSNILWELSRVMFVVQVCLKNKRI